MDKSLLTVSDNPKGELARSFERALKFLPDEKYKIEMVPHEFDWKKPPESPDVLLILDANPQESSYTSGVGFLRKFWATGLKQKLPPTILLSFDTPQKLFQRDKRHVVTLLEGVEHVTVPAKLEDILETIENSPVRPNVETVKEYLKISCELGFERRIEHARRNFIGPYSLILGASCVNNVSPNEYEKTINNLKSSEDRDELRIYDAVLGSDRKGSGIKSDEIDELLRKDPLSTILKGKKILLIDDECKTAGWEEVLKAIFGPYVTLDAVGKETTKDTKWREWTDVDNNSEINSKLAVQPDKGLIDYDLILSDLYLTDEDNKKKEDRTKPFHKYSGLQLLEKIRKQDQSVPVILFTASSRAFNVKAAEEIGIDGYFQKEGRYRNEDEAVRYYAEFRNLAEKCTCQERMALREIWKGIKIFVSKYRSDKKGERKSLYRAYMLLQLGGEDRKQFGYQSQSFYKEAIEILGRINPLTKKEMGKHNDPLELADLLTGMSSPLNDENVIKKISNIISHSMRNIAVHCKDSMSFDDAILSFSLVFKAFGINNIDIKLTDPCIEWMQDTESMINNICQCCCDTGRLCEDEKNKCKGFNEIVLKRTAYLFRDKYRQSKAKKKNNDFFCYLYLLQCINKAKTNSHFVNIMPLIKRRLTNYGDFCPPFKDGYWVGIEQADGSINSPLGNLKAEMVKEEKKREGDKVLFNLTKKYLRGR